MLKVKNIVSLFTLLAGISAGQVWGMKQDANSESKSNDTAPLFVLFNAGTKEVPKYRSVMLDMMIIPKALEKNNLKELSDSGADLIKYSDDTYAIKNYDELKQGERTEARVYDKDGVFDGIQVHTEGRIWTCETCKRIGHYPVSPSFVPDSYSSQEHEKLNFREDYPAWKLYKENLEAILNNKPLPHPSHIIELAKESDPTVILKISNNEKNLDIRDISILVYQKKTADFKSVAPSQEDIKQLQNLKKANGLTDANNNTIDNVYSLDGDAPQGFEWVKIGYLKEIELCRIDDDGKRTDYSKETFFLNKTEEKDHSCEKECVENLYKKIQLRLHDNIAKIFPAKPKKAITSGGMEIKEQAWQGIIKIQSILGAASAAVMGFFLGEIQRHNGQYKKYSLLPMLGLNTFTSNWFTSKEQSLNQELCVYGLGFAGFAFGAMGARKHIVNPLVNMTYKTAEKCFSAIKNSVIRKV